MPGMTIRHASAMPASTWSWLKMNDVTIQIPDDLERNCQVEIEAGDTLDNTTSFEGSVAALQGGGRHTRQHHQLRRLRRRAPRAYRQHTHGQAGR